MNYLSHYARNGFIMLIQLLRKRPFRLYLAGRLIEYSLFISLSSCGKVSLRELNTPLFNFSLIIRDKSVPPVSNKRNPVTVTQPCMK